MPTKIEWCKRPNTIPESWNVTAGCTKCSPGCTRCYAERMAIRLAYMVLADIDAKRNPGRKRHYLDVVDLERKCWNGQIKLVPEALDDPTHWKKARTVFVDSMSDLFHIDVPDDFICDVFYEMSQATDHTFIILTKRPRRMYEWFNRPEAQDSKWHQPLPNVIGMVTVENQEQADRRIPWLLRCPFAILGVSIEPMLEFVNLNKLYTTPPHRITGQTISFPWLDCGWGIDWVIVGGETGPRAREMNPDWARGIRDQCKASGTSFFMKQMSNRAPIPDDLLIREWPEIHS